MKRKSTDHGITGGRYFILGILFFLCLFMLGSLLHATYVPRQNDIVPCDQVYTILKKQVRYDSFGYEYAVSFTNGQVLSIYDANEYNKFPESGQVWIRMIEYRMRLGATIGSWLPIETSNTGVNNACVVISGEPQEPKEMPQFKDPNMLATYQNLDPVSRWIFIRAYNFQKWVEGET